VTVQGEATGQSVDTRLKVIPFNYSFVLERAKAICPTGKILDYGCGAGEVVAAGVDVGLDIYGTETFYGGAPGQRALVAEQGLLNSRILEMKQGRIPFPDRFFDFVLHNQVFEHVEDLDGVLVEIGRVLKQDGVMLSLFPSREVIREGHCGIPFAHRFRKDSKLGYLWLLAFRKLGFGTHHGQKTPEQWAKDFMEWLYAWCYYRPRAEILEAYRRAGFSFDSDEMSYVISRLNYRDMGWLVPIARLSPRLTRYTFRKLGGMVVQSRKNH
jgi:SAM-dependent methyltransferase